MKENNKVATLEQQGKGESPPLCKFFSSRPNFVLAALEEASPGSQPQDSFSAVPNKPFL